MDPRIPVNQQPPPPMLNNLQSNYMQSQSNKFGANGHGQYMRHPMRPPNFQTPSRLGRTVPTVGPIAGKVHPMDGMSDYPPDGVIPMNTQGMVSSMNMPGEPLPSGYQRGSQMFQYQNPNMASPGPGVRTPHLSPQQPPVYNQMPAQLPMDMMQQQRFQSPMQGPPGGPRFPNVSPGSHPPEPGISVPVPTPDSSTIAPMLGHPSSYETGFGVKNVSRPLPPPLQMPQQQIFSPQQPPIASPLNMPSQTPHQKSQPNSSIAMSNIEAMESYRQQQQQSRQSFPSQPPMGMPQQQQHQVAPPPTGQQSMGSMPPMVPHSFPLPPQGTPCILCSRDLTEPPAPPSSTAATNNNNLNCLYPPIQCEAGCRGWFHLPCSGLTLDAFYLLKSESNFVEWLCTPCANQAYPNIPYIRPRNQPAH